MNVTLRVWKDQNNFGRMFDGPATTWYAKLASPADANGNVRFLLLPGALAYDTSRKALVDKVLAHLQPFGFNVTVQDHTARRTPCVLPTA